jgi:hypothetical protein
MSEPETSGEAIGIPSGVPKASAPKVDPTPIKQTTSELFVRAVRDEIRCGYGITPFIGSGLSSRSGILMGMEFDEYLTYIVARCVLNKKDQAECFGKGTDRWNVMHDGWPHPPKPMEVDRVRKWVKERFEKICIDYGAKPEWDDSGIYVKSFGPTKVAPLESLDSKMRRPLIPRILRSGETKVEETGIRDFLRHFGERSMAQGEFISEAMSPDSQRGIEERAIRSLYDWRAMLHFLSELDVHKLDGVRRPFIGRSRPSVIDSFNQHITHGRKPNLGHSMLAHLAAPMRTRIILTTNFDTLIEDAFEQTQENFAVHSVESGSTFPDPDSVHAQNSIVKLHGFRTNTRADFTLDDTPTQIDKHHFFHYVVGSRPPIPEKGPLVESIPSPEPPFLPTHLLVAGFSGSDRRVVQLMKYLLDHNNQVRIFWICYDNRDYERVNRLFAEEYGEAGRLLATISDRPDLLFLELFQELTFGLPKGGFSYQFSQDVPPKLWENRAKQQESVPSPAPVPTKITAEIEALSKAIADVRRDHETKIHEQIANTAKGKGASPKTLGCDRLESSIAGENPCFYVDRKAGLMVALRAEFNALTAQRFSCIWLEMEDFTDSVALGHSILQNISLNQGLYQLEHAVLIPTRFKKKEDEGVAEADWTSRFRELVRYFRIQPERWVIFLYGRNVPGMCAGWDLVEWTTSRFTQLHNLIAGLRKNGFITIYAPYTKERFENDSDLASGVKNQLKGWMSGDKAKRWRPLKKLPGSEGVWVPDRLAVKLEWIDNSPQEPRPGKVEPRAWKKLDPELLGPGTTFNGVESFLYKTIESLYEGRAGKTGKISWDEILNQRMAHMLYAMSLFRRSRPSAIFVAESVFPALCQLNTVGLDNDWMRYFQAQSWMEEFKSKGFVHRKPGGNSWLYRDTRLTIQMLLESCADIKIGSLFVRAAWEMRARTHFWIATWYVRAYITTNNHVPIIEACHHYFQSIVYSIVAAAPSQKSPKRGATTKRIGQYRRFVFIRSITSWIKLLQLSRAALMYWVEKGAAEAMFGDEAREMIFKRMGDVRDKLFKQGSADKEKYLYRWERAERLQAELLAEMESIWCEYCRWPYIPAFISDPPNFATSTRGNAGAGSRHPAARGTAKYEARREKWLDGYGGSYNKKIVFAGLDWRTQQADSDDLKTKREIKTGKLITGFIEKLEKHEREPIGNIDKQINRGKKLYKDLKEITFDRLADADGPNELPQLVASMYDLAYLHVRRAKFLEHESSNAQAHSANVYSPSSPKSRKLWIQVTTICRCIIDACRMVPPEFLHFEMMQRVRAFSTYALAHGRLARFAEAHRRLNEAHALLSKIAHGSQIVEPAMIDLRRAEVHLHEAIFLKNLRKRMIEGPASRVLEKDNLEAIACGIVCDVLQEPINDIGNLPEAPGEQLAQQWLSLYHLNMSNDCVASERLGDDAEKKRKLACKRMDKDNAKELRKNWSAKWMMIQANAAQLLRLHYAALDDTWVCLEAAEKKLAGRSHSSQWWGRLCTLKLRVFKERIRDEINARAPYTCLAFRRKIEYHSYLNQLLQLGLCVWPDDPYRRIRLADYFIDAWQNPAGSVSQDDLRQAKELLGEATKEEAGYPLENPDYSLLKAYRARIEAKIDKFPEKDD